MKRLFMFTLFALAVSAACGRPFDLYQPIIDRCPFGEPPDDPTILPNQATKSSAATQEEIGEAELTQQQAELQQTVGVSVMNINPDGSVWVGFSVMGDQKNARHYYVAVGDESDGWLVKEADPSKGTVVFVKDSIEVPRKIGDTIAKSSGRGGARQQPQRGGMGRSPLIAGKSQLSDMPTASPIKSHRQLRREQDEAERKARLEQAEALKKMQEEESRRREEEKAERDAEREADKEEMRRNLMDMQEQLKRAREERRQREAEGGGDAQESND